VSYRETVRPRFGDNVRSKVASGEWDVPSLLDTPPINDYYWVVEVILRRSSIPLVEEYALMFILPQRKV